MNEEHYFVMLARQEHPPYYGSWTESLAIQKIRFVDRAVVEEAPLVAITHGYDDATNTWVTTYRDSVSLDLTEFLRSNGVLPAYSSDASCCFFIRDGTLWLETWGFEEVILSAEELSLQVPVLGTNPHIVAFFPPRTHGSGAGGIAGLFSLQFNEASGDDSWTDVLLVVPMERIQKASLELWEKKTTRGKSREDE